MSRERERIDDLELDALLSVSLEHVSHVHTHVPALRITRPGSWLRGGRASGWPASW